MQFSARTYNCLKRVNLNTMGDLATKTEWELRRIKNFGLMCMVEVKKALEAYGLTLGMRVCEHCGELCEPRAAAAFAVPNVPYQSPPEPAAGPSEAKP